MSTKRTLLAFLVVVLFATMGCTGRKVTRIPEDSITDLSGRWNDEDSRLVSEEMIADCLGQPWKMNHWEKTGQKPVVIVGLIKNSTAEHIPVKIFISDIERYFINSGQVTVVASAAERDEIRDERADQNTYSSQETMNQWGRELGADYLMGGEISQIIDQAGSDRVVYYQVDMTLIDLENNTKVWLGQKKIKKLIERAGTSL